jgi:hypothetical protein
VIERVSAAIAQGRRAYPERRTSLLNQESDAQQPEGGDTPGVAAAPVALAAAIMVGLVRSIEMLSLHAAVFGVGMTLGTVLMLLAVVSRPATGG